MDDAVSSKALLLVNVLEEAEDRHMASAKEEGTGQQPDRGSAQQWK